MARHKKQPDLSKAIVVRLFDKSGWSQKELARRMGYAGVNGRKSVARFLKQTNDPAISVLRRAAKAFKVPIEYIVAGEGTNK